MKPLLAHLLAWLVTAAAFAETKQEYPIIRDLGPMIPFYRNAPALTEWFHLTPETIQMPIPAFMTDHRIAFPYQKRPFDREILFCDNVNVVRFLGGWRCPGRFTNTAGSW